MDPDIIRRTLGLIKERREAQDFLEAQRLIDSLEEDQDNVPLTLESARVARSLGDYERAVRLANEVLKRNPGSAPARRIANQSAKSLLHVDERVAAADKLRRSRRFAEALAVLDEDGFPRNLPAARLVRCRTLAGMRDHGVALALAEQIAIDDPDNAAVADLIRSLKLALRRDGVKEFRARLNEWSLDEALAVASQIEDAGCRAYMEAEVELARGNPETATTLAVEAARSGVWIGKLYDLLTLLDRDTAEAYAASVEAGWPNRGGPENDADVFAILYASGRIGSLHDFTRDILGPLPIQKKARNSALSWHLLSLYAQGMYEDVIACCQPIDAFMGNASAVEVVVRSLLQLDRDLEALALFQKLPAKPNFKPLALQAKIRLDGAGPAYALYEASALPAAAKTAFPEKYRLEPVLSASPSDNVWIADHGIGDEIRHAAIYPRLSELAGRILISCDPRLATLMRRSFPQIDFLPVERWRHETRAGWYNSRRDIPGGRTVAINVDAELATAIEAAKAVGVVSGSLGVCLQNRRARGARRGGLIRPDPDRLKDFRKRYLRDAGPDQLITGISWRSTMSSTGRDFHYSTLEEWRDLLDQPNRTLVIVQSFLSDHERALLDGAKATVICLDDVDIFNDLENLAAALSALDFYIGPATSTSEMAGAVGTPGLFLANTYETAWRATHGGADFWHPSLRVVRPERYGENATMLRSAFKIVGRLQGLHRYARHAVLRAHAHGLSRGLL